MRHRRPGWSGGAQFRRISAAGKRFRPLAFGADDRRGSVAGIGVALVNPRLTGPEAGYICDDSGARVLFVHSSVEEVARSIAFGTIERSIAIGRDYDDWLERSRPGPRGIAVGDMARQDSEGYFYLVHRKVDVIISGGVNIYPREIEEVLHTHPAIQEAAVVGVPDDYWGEAVRAVVALRRGESVGADGLIEFCARSLARYKLPKSVEFVAALPRNAAGKVLKRNLRAAGGA